MHVNSFWELKQGLSPAQIGSYPYFAFEKRAPKKTILSPSCRFFPQKIWDVHPSQKPKISAVATIRALGRWWNIRQQTDSMAGPNVTEKQSNPLGDPGAVLVKQGSELSTLEEELEGFE